MSLTFQSNPTRRGNTIVLVTAILVLLVIIATAFISRTQAGRVLAGAQQRAFQREDHAQLVAEQIAAEVAQSLFTKPVDPYYQFQVTPGGFADELAWVQGGGPTGVLAASTWSSVPRSAIGTNPSQRFTAERFQVDAGDFVDIVSTGTPQLGTDGIPDGFFDFNFAPYETKPWTNWPDDPGNLLAVPSGPGAPLGLLVDDHGLAIGAGNPHGNPGFGDNRWLRETEPRRFGNYYDGMTTNQAISQNDDPYTERYTHWTHLSWIPTAENGWRVCYDISNVAPLDAAGGSLGPENGNTLSTYAHETDSGVPYAEVGFPVALQTPYEQWYSNIVPQRVDPVLNGDYFELPPVGGADWFAGRRDDWFGTPQVHFNAAKNAFGALPNFIDLNNMRHAEQVNRWADGNDTGQDDDVANEIRRLRQTVERTFCDTDGDGFTDSFWFVPPTPVDRGVRQVVGVSVIDNASMLDANVATIFDRWSTSGTTPADVALVSRLDDSIDTHVGLFADPKNAVDDADFYPTMDGMRQRYRVNRWAATPISSAPTFLNMRGLSPLVEQPDSSPGPFYGQYRAIAGQSKDDPSIGELERRLWNRAAQRDGNGAFINTTNSAVELVPFTTTPFSIADELELRAYAGQNHPTAYSRFERSLDDIWDVGNQVPGSGQNLHTSILRSSFERQETTPVRMLDDGDGQPLVGKLSNEQLVRDVRHRVTLFSGTRNELRPLWLWQTPFFRIDYDYDRDGDPEFDPSGNMITPGDYDDFLEYERRKRKIDLRQSYTLPTTTVDVNSSHPDYPAVEGSGEWRERQRIWLSDLQDTITRTMTVYGTLKPDPTNPSTWRTLPQSYFSDPTVDAGGDGNQSHFTDAYVRSLKMAASYAANIESFRDSATVPYTYGNETILVDPPLHPIHALRVPQFDPNDGTYQMPASATEDAFIGMEKQPFIMQTFFAKVYPKSKHGEGPPDPNGTPPGAPAWPSGDTIPMIPGFEGAGEHYVNETSKPAIIIAVQLGNPFHEPFSLIDFKLRVGDGGGGVGELLSFALMKCPHPEQGSSGGVLGGYQLHDLQLGPTEPEAPRSAIVFAVVPPAGLGFGPEFEDGTGNIPGFGVSYEEFKTAWLDFLDLQPGDLFGYEEDMNLTHHQTLVLDASTILNGKFPASDEGRLKWVFGDYDVGNDPPETVVSVFRTIQSPFAQPAHVELDRIQHNREDQSDPRDTKYRFSDTMANLNGNPEYMPAKRNDTVTPARGFEFSPFDTQGHGNDWAGVLLGSDDFYLTWTRVSRIWGWDVNASGMYDMNEISPRYAFSLVSGPEVTEYEGDDLDGKSYSGSAFTPQTFVGHKFSIADLATGEPDRNPWIERDFVLPVTKLDDRPTGSWTWEQNPPRPWIVRGKPTNFPTWTVTTGASGVAYGLGFPIEVKPDGNNWDTATGYVLEARQTSPATGAAVNFALEDVIPMDLGATPVELAGQQGEEQRDFYWDARGGYLRKDLWFAPFQMLLKDDDFEQIGELNHVLMWGPVLHLPQNSSPSGMISGDQVRTFAEVMTEIVMYDSTDRQGGGDPGSNPPNPYGIDGVDEYPVGYGVFANRLNIDLGFDPPEGTDPHFTPAMRPWRQVLGAGRYMHVPAFRPKLPAGVGLFDAVTVDGRGFNAPHPDLNNDAYYAMNEAMRGEVDRYDLARGYSGEPTKGLINVNTASVEVMRALPQMSRLVYNDYFEDPSYTYDGDGTLRGKYQRSATGTPAGEDRFGASFSNHMHIRFAEVIERYRLGDAVARYAMDINDGSGVPQPSMADRGFVGREFDDLVTGSSTDLYDSIGTGFYGYFPGMRNDRGISSLGELLTMQRTPYEEYELINGVAPPVGSRWAYRNSSVRGLALNPYSNIGVLGWDGGVPTDPGNAPSYARERYRFGWRDTLADELPFPPSGNGPAVSEQADARVSTDRNTLRRTLLGKRNIAGAPTTEFAPDIVGGDAEEMSMLFSGIANILTTRSDVFTVYLKVRTFKQDPATGIWDASEDGMIIDDSRYLMVIDRSGINAPTDKPRILAFAKIE